MQGLYVWVCVSVLFPRIEPVGKPYRESAFKLYCDLGRFIDRVAVPFRIGTQIERFFFFFLFFKWLFWVVVNILSTNELKKKNWVFVGFDPGSSESGV